LQACQVVALWDEKQVNKGGLRLGWVRWLLINFQYVLIDIFNCHISGCFIAKFTVCDCDLIHLPFISCFPFVGFCLRWLVLINLEILGVELIRFRHYHLRYFCSVL